MSRIVVDRNVLAGKPVIKGTRISVDFILDLLASCMAVERILKEYPHLKREDILAALAYATSVLRNEEVYAIAQLA